MHNKIMPIVPSYLKWLVEVSLLNNHHGLVELMTLDLQTGFFCGDSHLWKPEKVADV